MYDFSNTIFSMNVSTLYFSVWLVGDLGASSISYSIASAVAFVTVSPSKMKAGDEPSTPILRRPSPATALPLVAVM